MIFLSSPIFFFSSSVGEKSPFFNDRNRLESKCSIHEIVIQFINITNIYMYMRKKREREREKEVGCDEWFGSDVKRTSKPI